MVRNQKVSGTAMSVPVGVGVGIGAAILLTILGTLIVAWLINQETMPRTGIGYGAMVTLAISSVAGAWTAATLVKHQRLLVCMATGGVYLLTLLGLTAFCFGGQYQGVIPTALLVLGGSMAAALIGIPGQGNRTSGRHKHRYS